MLTLFPINETKPTPVSGVTAESVWVGLGAAPDLLGRDLKSKAVLVYSTFVPGGRSHSASDRAGLFNSDTLMTKAGAAMIINVMAVPGNGRFDPEGAPTGRGAIPTMTIRAAGRHLLEQVTDFYRMQLCRHHNALAYTVAGPSSIALST